jgi:xanthine dehydrogenase YagS FAD-binding subunit
MTADLAPSWREWLARIQAVDEPPPFRLVRPATLAEAVAVLAKDPDGAAVMGGGTELIVQLRRRNRAPAMVVSLDGVPGLDALAVEPAGLAIGAAVTLEAVAGSPLVSEVLPALAEAAGSVAVPQIRSQATVVGNLLQLPRCLYLARGFPCLRTGGVGCPAAEAGTGADLSTDEVGGCRAICGSDLAAALTAAGASVELAGPGGARTVDVPALVAHRPGPAEIVARIVVPLGPLRFAKAAPANGGPFDAVSVAVGARVAVAGVAPVPWRWRQLEERMRAGSPTGDDLTVPAAARKAALAGRLAAGLLSADRAASGTPPTA